MKILMFGDIHFHHTHRFSQITPEGFSVRELEHLSCADDIIDLCIQEHVDVVQFLGDMFGPTGDNISCQTLAVVTEFIRKISKSYKFDIITGNHDCSSHINNRYSHKLAPFKWWDKVEIYDEPIVMRDRVYMPYCISDEYATSFLESIEDKENKIVFSHLEIKGINIGNGIFTQKGVELSLLKQFKRVFQGHYHSITSLAKNIHVAGSTQRLSFKDPGLARNNILIYDTETDKCVRRSFKQPDWLVFDDDNIDAVLNIDNNNYVKLEISTDILLTDEIKQKLEKVKGKSIHIDINRISVNRQINEEVNTEDEVDVIKQFVNKSDNTPEQKEALIQEGVKLVKRVQN